MLTRFNSGEIWKGSNQQMEVVLVPRCFNLQGEITDVVLNFYTTVGGTSIEFSGDTVTVSGKNATVVFQPVQLEALDDGLIRYVVECTCNNDHHVFNLDTSYILKTPDDYEPIDFISHSEAESIIAADVAEAMGDYYTSGQTDTKIDSSINRLPYCKIFIDVDANGVEALDSSHSAKPNQIEYSWRFGETEASLYYVLGKNVKIIVKKAAQRYADYTVADVLMYRTKAQAEAAIADASMRYGFCIKFDFFNSVAEKWRTAVLTGVKSGNTWVWQESYTDKQDVDLSDYYTSAQTDNKIAEAFSAATASGVTRQELNDAIATETARTEQTYLKEHQSLADYYTSAQTDSAISTAVQDKVESTTITQIWTGSQAQYDVMTGHSANILYIINS